MLMMGEGQCRLSGTSNACRNVDTWARAASPLPSRADGGREGRDVVEAVWKDSVEDRRWSVRRGGSALHGCDEFRCANESDSALEVIGEDVEAYFSSNVLDPAHLEVASSHPVLES